MIYWKFKYSRTQCALVIGVSDQKNIWIGAFIPNIYGDFELIEFEIN